MSQITRVGDLSRSHHLSLFCLKVTARECCNWPGNLKRSGVDPARESRAEFTEKARPELSLEGEKKIKFLFRLKHALRN